MATYLTFATLSCTLAAAVALRLWWPRLSARRRRHLRILALVVVVPPVLTMVTKWDVLSHRANEVELWIRLVACQFALVFFTLLRPRALSTAIAVVLLPFGFSTSVVGPLSGLFRPEQISSTPIADGYVLQTLPWHSDVSGNSGVDYSLVYLPAHMLGVRRDIAGTRFYSSRCDTSAVYALLHPATHTLDVFCPQLSPSAPLAGLSGSHDHYLIPPGALSPALRRLAHK